MKATYQDGTLTLEPKFKTLIKFRCPNCQQTNVRGRRYDKGDWVWTICAFCSDEIGYNQNYPHVV